MFIYLGDLGVMMMGFDPFNLLLRAGTVLAIGFPNLFFAGSPITSKNLWMKHRFVLGEQGFVSLRKGNIAIYPSYLSTPINTLMHVGVKYLVQIPKAHLNV